MKPLPVRRRALAIMAVGLAFLALGLRGGHHTTYVFVAICFFAVGVATLKRGGRKRLP